MNNALLTFHDVYEHLLDMFELYGKDEEGIVRRLRRAISSAYRNLTTMANWRYFVRETMVTTDTKYATGTVEYSSSTGRVTLTGGTWPTDAIYGFVSISDVRYPITRRISSTIVELDENARPAADVASGTSYEWFRYRYLLPLDVGEIRQVTDAASAYELRSVTQEYAFWRSEILNADTFPNYYGVFRSRLHHGRWELWLGVSGSSARQVRIQYQARLANAFIDEIASGTVDTTDDTFTLSSAVLTEDCVGAVLRIASDANKPTPRFGSYDDTDSAHTENFPESERVITQYSSTTAGVMNRPLSSDVSTKGYTISTLIDVDPGSMWVLFLRECEYQYRILAQSSPQEIALAAQIRDEALRMARIDDGPKLKNERQTYRTLSETAVISE